MEITIDRTYAATGTNGVLKINGELVCYTIELPWLDNARRVSCIPAGTYSVEKRFSLKFGKHLLVTGVPNRDLILFHPANDALKELNGCIAPVSKLEGAGRGIRSRLAVEMLRDEVYSAINKGEAVFLTIK